MMPPNQGYHQDNSSLFNKAKRLLLQSFNIVNDQQNHGHKAWRIEFDCDSNEQLAAIGAIIRLSLSLHRKKPQDALFGDYDEHTKRGYIDIPMINADELFPAASLNICVDNLRDSIIREIKASTSGNGKSETVICKQEAHQADDLTYLLSRILIAIEPTDKGVEQRESEIVGDTKPYQIFLTPVQRDRLLTHLGVAKPCIVEELFKDAITLVENLKAAHIKSDSRTPGFEPFSAELKVRTYNWAQSLYALIEKALDMAGDTSALPSLILQDKPGFCVIEEGSAAEFSAKLNYDAIIENLQSLRNHTLHALRSASVENSVDPTIKQSTSMNEVVMHFSDKESIERVRDVIAAAAYAIDEPSTLEGVLITGSLEEQAYKLIMSSRACDALLKVRTSDIKIKRA